MALALAGGEAPEPGPGDEGVFGGVENEPLTILTTRTPNATFGPYLARWGVTVKAPLWRSTVTCATGGQGQPQCRGL
jgi:hypothetical protein